MTSARTATLIALLLSAMTATALLLIDPPGACPGWHPRHSSTSLWEMLVTWTVPILAFHCFIVVRWDWCLRKAAEKDQLNSVPVEYILTRMCLMGAAASQLPFFLVLDCIGK